jgi:DNA adenine methylase
MIPWIGGKYRQSKWIYETSIKNLVENGHIKTYAEPFSGAFWNYLKTDIYKYVNKSVYNDKNKFMSNVFYCVKNKREQLIKEFEKMKPANNVDFERSKKIVFNNVENAVNFKFRLGNVEVASAYAYSQTHSFSGCKITPGMKLSPKVSKFGTFLKRIKDENSDISNFKEKIDKLSVNNKDYKEVIKENDNEDTLFYVDPPYFKKEFFYRFHDFKRDEHKKLAKVLKNIKGKFILSYYYFDGIEELYPKDKFHYFSKEFSKSSSNKKNKDKGTEIIICNYNPSDYKVEVANNVDYKSNEVKKTRKTRVNKTDKIISLLENLTDKITKLETKLDNLEKEVNELRSNVKETKKIEVVNNVDYKKDEIITKDVEVKTSKKIRETKDIINNIELRPINNVNDVINNLRSNPKHFNVLADVEFKRVVNNTLNIDNNIEPINNIDYEPKKLKVINKRDNRINEVYKRYLLNNINNITIKLNEVLNDNLYTPNSPNLRIS